MIKRRWDRDRPSRLFLRHPRVVAVFKGGRDARVPGGAS